MRICICDDDSITHQDIKNCLAMFFTDTGVQEITDMFSGNELVAHYAASGDFDIIFLDIEMEKTNGIDTAAQIREISPEVIIIFVSSHKKYVFDVFRCEAFHFLVKPINRDEFNDVFNRALHKHRTKNEMYHVSWHGQRHSLPISEILYIEGYRRRLKIFTATEIYEHVGKVTDVYERLKLHGFLQVHQGFIVNMRFIKKFGSKEITLTDDTKVPIGGRRRPEALKMYDKYIQNWKW